MLRPTPEEVLKSISYTFDTLIRPDPTSALAISYSLTVSNMLRQLLLTMQHEERLITEDTAVLRSALQHARRYLAGTGSDGPMADAIGAALGRTCDGPEPAHWARENWRALRGTLEKTITYLQGIRDRRGQEDSYRTTRQTLRDYLDKSLDPETKLIDGAFTLARR